MSDPASKSTPHNSGVKADPEATFDSVAAPAGFSAPDLGSIGPYRLIRKLGEGGMGQVWLAEQSAPVKRQVALKIIKGGRYDDSALLRFDVERQALAIMDHPAIAKVFDAGSTAEGQPYFVMEYVPGLPITDYCDRKRLPARERLALFIKVCEGVQHAHQKAIMHRDLKPSNILVVEVDGKPTPRIIDFGIAKAMSQQAGDETLVTRAGGMVGTPGYMSPEQADPSVLDVDTRTDVYSLGVVLYELLTGVLPFDVKQWKTKPFHEVLRQLHEEDPTSPSTRISGDTTSKSVAEKRDTDPRQLASLLRGDLDWITLKAVEKDRARRYGTPSELAADINRYLQNEPVTARPASAAYRAKKYVQRHKALVAGTATVFAVLVAGVIVSTWEAARARTAERRATAEAAVAKATSDFLENDLLAQADAAKQSGPDTKPDPDLKVRTVLDRAAAKIEGKFDQQPEVEASIRNTIGDTYHSLGVYPEARKQLERALELRRKVLGNENPQTLRTALDLARVADAQGKYAEAEAIENRALEIERRVLGPEHPDTLRAMAALAHTYYDEDNYAQAEALYSKTLEIERRVLGPEHPDTLRAMDGLADTYDQEGKYAQAEALLTQSLEIRRRVSGPEHPDTLVAMAGLADNYNLEGKYAQAEALLTQSLEIARRVLGPEHPRTVYIAKILADTYYFHDKYAQAEALYGQTLEIRRRVLGPEHPSTLNVMMCLGRVYGWEEKNAQATALLNQTLKIQRRVLGPENPETLMTMQELGLVYLRPGKYAQAEALLTQSLEIRRRVSGPEHPETLHVMGNLASAYYGQGKYAQAEALLTQTLEIERRVSGPEHPDTLIAMQNLAFNAYIPLGKYAEAEALQSQILEIRRRVSGAEDPETISIMDDVAAVYRDEGKYAEAEALYGQAIELERRVLGPEKSETLASMNGLALTYYLQRKYAQADALYTQTLAGRRRTLGAEHPDTLDTMADFALVHQAQGKFAAAEALAREAVEADRKIRPDDWQRFFAESLLGASLAGEKKYDAAEPLLLEGYRGMNARKQKIGVPDRYHLDRAREWLEELYQAWGKPDKAAEWRKVLKPDSH